ncbi:MAG: DinB family protein [Bacteroidetes bacterium]|nr:DinB family protein [Bacteroidota bacterium]
MNRLFIQLEQQLNYLSELLASLTDEQYQYSVLHLGNASIGGHTRHILELLECAIAGNETGIVDYVNRKRNLELQNKKVSAQALILNLITAMKAPDRILTLLTDETKEHALTGVSTTYFREIVYNTEHTIHHLALIKVALVEMQLSIVNEDFGMAYSTLKYKATLSNAS